MLKFLGALAASLFLSACVSTGSIERNLQGNFMGKPVDAAIASFGYPDSDRWVAGKHVYTWTSGRTMPNMTTLSSGQVVLQGSSSYSCVLNLEVDERNTVKGYSFSGQIAACEAFN